MPTPRSADDVAPAAPAAAVDAAGSAAAPSATERAPDALRRRIRALLAAWASPLAERGEE